MAERGKARADQKAGERNALRSQEASDKLSPPTWPFDAEGDPLVEVSFLASELVGLENYFPDLKFSNINVGPAGVRTLVSLNDPEPFTDEQLANVARALTRIAETSEGVISDQREIAIEGMKQS